MSTTHDDKRSLFRRAVEKPEYIPVVDPAGTFASFVMRVLGAFRFLPKYSGEVLRQIGLLATGSVLVIVGMSFVAGTSCGIAAEAFGQQIGAGLVGPLFSSFCVNREIVPFVFGFILAAKVGGGIVAELGAMRVNDEIDAMDVMGIPSMTFAVASRLAAVVIVMPIAYIVALGAAEGAAWIGSYVRSGSVSQGTWEFAFYTVTSLTDILLSFVKGMVMTISVVLVALYFGYNVGGGPVEVGTATARSMAVNLIVVTILNMAMTFLFWGFNPRLPIA
jgi:phospholipid/cholesterol/gamma-HCH transport system permease protein